MLRRVASDSELSLGGGVQDDSELSLGGRRRRATCGLIDGEEVQMDAAPKPKRRLVAFCTPSIDVV